MQHFVHSEPGENHQNEDFIAIRQHPADGALLCALADGQGGQAGGAVAAQIAVWQSLELAAEYTTKQLLEGSSWYEILSAADEAVAEHPDAGFTTLIASCVTNGTVRGVSCGDSAALLINRDGFIDLTEEQRKNPPVGSSAAFPTAFSAKLHSGSSLLIMSDGVWKYAGFDLICDIARSRQGQDLITALRQLQLDRNGGKLPDDFSIIVIQ